MFSLKVQFIQTTLSLVRHGWHIEYDILIGTVRRASQNGGLRTTSPQKCAERWPTLACHLSSGKADRIDDRQIVMSNLRMFLKQTQFILYRGICTTPSDFCCPVMITIWAGTIYTWLKCPCYSFVLHKQVSLEWKMLWWILMIEHLKPILSLYFHVQNKLTTDNCPFPSIKNTMLTDLEFCPELSAASWWRVLWAHPLCNVLAWSINPVTSVILFFPHTHVHNVS